MSFPASLGLSGDRNTPLAAELLAGIQAACADHDVPVRWANRETDERQVGAVLAIGFPGLHPQLLERAASTRRVLWYGENLPPPGGVTLATRLLRGVPSARLLDLLIGGVSVGGRVGVPVRLRRWRARAGVEREWSRNVRELREAARSFHRIVVITRDRAASAGQLGLRAHVAPFGYHEAMAGPLVSPDARRQTPVVLLGRDFDLRTRRGFGARSVLAALPRSLAPSIIERGLYGAERTEVLSGARVVIDIHRVPGNSSGLRFVLASAAGAAVISEPSLDSWPLVPGTHFIEAPIDRISEATQELLADEPRRQQMVKEAQQLLRGPLAMWECLKAALGDEVSA